MDFKPPTYWEMLCRSGWALVITTLVPLTIGSVCTIVISREFNKVQTQLHDAQLELEVLRRICPGK